MLRILQEWWGKLLNFFATLLRATPAAGVDHEEESSPLTTDVEASEASTDNDYIFHSTVAPSDSESWNASRRIRRRSTGNISSFEIRQRSTEIQEEVPRPPQPSGHLSYWKLVVIGVYAFCGTSFTSASFAMRDGGWFSLLLLLVVSIAAYMSAVLLGLLLNENENIASYEDLWRIAEIPGGPRIVSILNSMLCYATCVAAVILIKDNMEFLFPDRLSEGRYPITVGLLLTATLLLIFLVTLCVYTVRDENPWIPGVGGTLMAVVLILLILIFLSSDDAKNTKNFNAENIHISFGFFVYFLCGHTVIPLIYRSLRDKAYYRRTLLLVVVISTGLYVGAGCVGYGMFGDGVQPTFTLNFSPKLGLSIIIIACTVVDNSIRFMLNITPVVNYSNQLLEKCLAENSGHRPRRAYQVMIKFMLVILTLAPAILHDVHDDIYVQLIGLGGAIVGVTVAFLVPAACFLNIRGTNSTTIWRICAYILFATGVLGTISTTVKSILDMIT